MRYLFLLTLLSPILIIQAMYVRRTIVRLAEPEGNRAGEIGQGKPLRVLILGDSAAAGVGVDHQTDALSGQLVAELMPYFAVTWQLLAKTGHKITDTINLIETTSPQSFDVAIISIGVNDVTNFTSLNVWQTQLKQLQQLLSQKVALKQIIYTTVPPMEAFPALPFPLNWILGLRAKMLNQNLFKFANEHHNSEIIQPNFLISREFIAQDGFHPSDVSYHTWAQQLAQVIVKRWL